MKIKITGLIKALLEESISSINYTEEACFYMIIKIEYRKSNRYITNSSHQHQFAKVTYIILYFMMSY